MDEIILLDKPAGMSSFGVVARVRRRLSDRLSAPGEQRVKVKVGHTGTLDPFATGLLVLLAGKATKRSGEFLKLDKVYRATLRFGYQSTTGDPEGELTPTGRPLPTRAELLAVLPQFTGKIRQTPPAFSAIKIAGVRAYKLARSGQAVELPSREVEIYVLRLEDWGDDGRATLWVHCSSGTYIRSLAADIGRVLGCGAYLTALRRLKVGSYDVATAVALEQFMGGETEGKDKTHPVL